MVGDVHRQVDALVDKLADALEVGGQRLDSGLFGGELPVAGGLAIIVIVFRSAIPMGPHSEWRRSRCGTMSVPCTRQDYRKAHENLHWLRSGAVMSPPQ